MYSMFERRCGRYWPLATGGEDTVAEPTGKFGLWGPPRIGGGEWFFPPWQPFSSLFWSFCSSLPFLSSGILKGLITREISPGELLLSLLSLNKERGKNSLSFELGSNLDANMARKACESLHFVQHLFLNPSSHRLQAGPPFLHAGERKGA